MKMKKRLIFAVIIGAVLGVFCIIGAAVRFDGQKDWIYLFSLWYNRILMGLLIGVCPRPGKLSTALIRGAILGLLVSFAFFATTGFTDIVSFVAGIVYGIIIDSVLMRIEKQS
jgi:hypothetical protein